MKKIKVRRVTIIGDKIEVTTRMATMKHKDEPEETELKPPKKEK